jgi:hypothetical protein
MHYVHEKSWYQCLVFLSLYPRNQNDRWIVSECVRMSICEATISNLSRSFSVCVGVCVWCTYKYIRMYRDNINRDWEGERDRFSLALTLSHHNNKVRKIDTEHTIFWKHVCVCLYVFWLNLTSYLYFHVHILLLVFHEKWNNSVNNGSFAEYECGLCRGSGGES